MYVAKLLIVLAFVLTVGKPATAKLVAVETHFKQNGCIATNLTGVTPFMVGDTCSTLTDRAGVGSIYVNCSENGPIVWTRSSTNCTGGSFSFAGACSSNTESSVRYGCADLPDDELVQMTISTKNCASETNMVAGSRLVSFIQRVNKCMPFPWEAAAAFTDYLQPSSYITYVQEDGTIVFRRYSNKDCSGRSIESFGGKLGACVRMEVPEGSHTLSGALAGGGVKFTPVVNGAKIKTVEDIPKDLANSASTAQTAFGVMAVLGVASMLVINN